MKVSELKELITQLPENELRNLVVELYKTIPLTIREEKQVDQRLQHLADAGDRKNEASNEDDFSTLEANVEQFIAYAYEGYYFIPNRQVPKKDQPKWRSLVKQYYKALVQHVNIPEYSDRALTMLIKLYRLLSHGCKHFIFGQPELFQTVGIPQREFFRRILVLKNEMETKRGFIEDAVRLLVESNLDRDTTATHLVEDILTYLTTPDLKEMAIEECDRLRTNIIAGTLFPDITEESARQDLINRTVEMGFLGYFSLREPETAIVYFKKNFYARTPEMTLYTLLSLLFHLKQPSHWRQEYESAVQNGIEPRKHLQKTYDYLMKNHEFPAHL